MRTCNNIKFLGWVDVAVLYVYIAVCIARHSTCYKCRLLVNNSWSPCFYMTVFSYMPFQSFEHVIHLLPPECYCCLYASLNTFFYDCHTYKNNTNLYNAWIAITTVPFSLMHIYNFERHFKPKQLSNGRIQRDFNTKNTKRLEIHAEKLVWEKITFNKKDNMSCGFSKTNT